MTTRHSASPFEAEALRPERELIAERPPCLSGHQSIINYVYLHIFMENQYYKELPKKRMGVGVLFLNEKNEILIIKPSYKDHWSVPGGVVDKNESPRRACIREVKEELGLDIGSLEFLCVDYVSTIPEKSENLQFIFFGGKLGSSQIAAIKLPPDEIAEHKFVSIDEALPLLSEKLSKRVSQCLTTPKRKTGLYLEDSQKV